jgi:2,5-diketo-D-gluconate reductase A
VSIPERQKLDAQSRLTLNDGASIPVLGLGVFSMQGATCERAVETALQAGYRHIDTAENYGNEASVGKAVAASRVPRNEVFITTKLWPGPDVNTVRGQVMRSLEKLRSDYVDLLLVHWPIGCYRQAWDVLVRLKEEGKCRSLGVSNFSIKRFERDFPLAPPVARPAPSARQISSALPALNQIEMHPFNDQHSLHAYCADRGIAVAAYSPLARAQKLQDPVLKQVAAAAGRSPAQVMIRFLLQRGVAAIPKSSQPARIRENISVFDFSLDADAMKKLEGLSNASYYSLRWRPPGYS